MDVKKKRVRVKAFFYEFFTLKKRIFIIFLFSSFIPFFCIALVSYFAIYSILTNKIQNSLQSNLKQVELSLENVVSNLNLISEQLAYEGSIGKMLEEVLSAKTSFDISQKMSDLKSKLSLITSSNPSIGLTMYFLQKDNTTEFENFPVKGNFSLDKQKPLLAQYYEISYYGPHLSNNRFDNEFVVSALRKVGLPDRDDVYIYIESGYQLIQNIMKNEQKVSGISYVFLNNDRKITYTELPAIFPESKVFSDLTEASKSGSYNGYYWFREKSNKGWSIVSVISKANYNKEMNQWFIQMIFFLLLFLVLTLLLAWLLWRMVYRPINKFDKEIKWMTQMKVQSSPTRTNIPEFDYLLNQFRHMKEQIWNLFEEVELKEKRRVDLEIEKLLYQINPHFLMNTLDTVHWLAIMNGQSEIDKLVTALNKLLYYNLGKLGQDSTIREEIEAVKEYLTLQQIRYDFQFDVRIHIDDTVLDMPIPRFILQPLVENSLYHGLNDHGYIDVSIKLEQSIQISIHDNGAGMSDETIQSLLNNKQNENEKVGMGIGMNYVKRMIEVQYGDRAKLTIRSALGKGTSILLSIPVLKEMPHYD